METRHPAASSTGTATSAGTTVPSWSPVMYAMLTAATCRGKYFLTSGGATTLPMPIPASATRDPTPITHGSWARARRTWPAAAAVIASTVSSSSPIRRSTIGVRTPQRANIAVGTIPSSPIPPAPRPISASMTPSRGLREVTAVRRLSETRTTPSRATTGNASAPDGEPAREERPFTSPGRR